MAGLLNSLVDATRQSQGLEPIFVAAPTDNTPILKDESPYEEMIFPSFAMPGVKPDQFADEFRTLYKLQKDVFRCVWIKSNSLAAQPWNIWLDNADGTSEDITEDEEFDVLRDPYPRLTDGEFWEATVGFLELSGENFWVFPETDARGRPTQIMSVRPDAMEVIPSATDMIAGYHFQNETEAFDLGVDDVVFLKYWDPSRPHRGQSPLRAGTRNVELELRAMSVNLDQLKKGNRPSGFISLKQDVKQDVWDRFKRDFRIQYDQGGRIGETMFLRGDVDWTSIGFTGEDIYHLAMLDHSGDSVGELYGVPPAMRMKFKEASKLANVEEQSKIFWGVTMTLLAKKISLAVTKFLIPLLTDRPKVRFKFDLSGVTALQPDGKAISEKFEKAFKSGAASPNDIRENVLNLPRDDDPVMDQRFIPVGMIPINAKVVEPIVEEADVLDVAMKMLDEHIGPDEPEAWDIDKDIQSGLDAMTRIKAVASLDRIRETQGKLMGDKLATLFNEMAHEVVRDLNQQRAFKFEAAAVNIDVNEWAAKFEAAGKPHIAAALIEAAGDLADSVNGTYDFSGDPIGAGYVNTRSRTYAHQVAETSQQQLDDILSGSIVEGLSIDDTAVLINDFFDSKVANHARLIARTEVIGAANNGRMQSMKLNGFTKHRWFTQRDDRVREDHALMDGQVAEINQAFSNGDLYPQDINERCYTGPVGRENA